jgi:hypothetical protein
MSGAIGGHRPAATVAVIDGDEVGTAGRGGEGELLAGIAEVAE